MQDKTRSIYCSSFEICLVVHVEIHWSGCNNWRKLDLALEAGCYILFILAYQYCTVLHICFNMLNQTLSGAGLILWSKTRQEWIGNRTPQKHTAARESKLRWASFRSTILKTINSISKFYSCWFQSIYFPYKCEYIVDESQCSSTIMNCSFDASYETLLGTNKPFPQPIPLSVSLAELLAWFWYVVFSWPLVDSITFKFSGNGRLSCWCLGTGRTVWLSWDLTDLTQPLHFCL